MVAVGTTIAVQLLVAEALGVTGPSRALHLLLGSLLAMNMATVIRQGPRRDTAVTAAWAPLAAALGAVLATLTAPRHWLSLALFVVVSAAAVWVRRFGAPWFAGGFIVWQAYFFTLYLHPPLAALPGMLVAIAVSGAWVTALLLTVLHADPERTLRRTVVALRARARSVVSHCLDVLHDPGEARVQALRAQLVKLSEVTLLFDGQLGDPRALPEGITAAGLRRWIVSVEISCEELASAAVALAAPGEAVAPATLALVEEMLQVLGWGELGAARDRIRALRAKPHDQLPAVRRLVGAADTLLTAVEDWEYGRLRHQEGDGEYEPVVGLIGGNLPGTTVAQEGDGRGRLTAPSTWSTTSRTALQAGLAAALALAAGELISSQRFYWAVIAAFVAFTGTATVGETVRKSVARIAGTVAGLVAAVGLAQVTAGHALVSLAALLGCIFLAFYLQALSYAAMIFFITLMLGELYGILNKFSDSVLLVRLAETAAGAAAGILVSLLVLPSRTRPTLVRARRLLLEDLAELAGACALRLEGRAESHRLLTDAIRLDEAARQVLRSADSLVRVPGLDRDHPGRRHRVAVLGVCASTARSLVPAVLAAPADPPPQLAQACRLIAAEAQRLADVPDLRHLRAPAEGTPDLAGEVATLLEQASDLPVVLGRRLQRLADALALLVPRSGGS
ncbi:MAG TPA: FUSC family protein [Marmoricola sp.]